MFKIPFKTRGMNGLRCKCEFDISTLAVVIMFYCIVTIQMTVAVVHQTGESLMLLQK